ncbi:MAG: hypothetical protein KC589_07190 [Nanoarchaeota archaeon]|nr:hypothetical protein [Nanoarchaeota archaeon]
MTEMRFNQQLRKQIGRVIETYQYNIEDIILKLSMIDNIRDVVIDDNKNNNVKYRFKLTFIDESQSVYEIDQNGLVWKILVE